MVRDRLTDGDGTGVQCGVERVVEDVAAHGVVGEDVILGRIETLSVHWSVSCRYLEPVAAKASASPCSEGSSGTLSARLRDLIVNPAVVLLEAHAQRRAGLPA